MALIRKPPCWETIGCENCIHRDTLHPNFGTEEDIYTGSNGIIERSRRSLLRRREKEREV